MNNSLLPDLNEDSFESILENQRREIFDAKTLHSDTDLAFNLQLEEAITVSLSLSSPSSSSTTSPPKKNGNILSVVKNDDVFDYMGLLLEDIERWDLEQRDREACEYLMSEMREDLGCRIHDQKLATEILRIPDAEWDQDGDNYNRPYGKGLGSVNNETFKVYCKGVESEEVVRDKKVIVGGVGVAVCDWRDNVILEVSKGLKVDDDKGEGVRSEEAVEIEAVVEGLDAALSLGLKNVTFCCDDFMVYQYVSA